MPPARLPRPARRARIRVPVPRVPVARENDAGTLAAVGAGRPRPVAESPSAGAGWAPAGARIDARRRGVSSARRVRGPLSSASSKTSFAESRPRSPRRWSPRSRASPSSPGPPATLAPVIDSDGAPPTSLPASVPTRLQSARGKESPPNAHPSHPRSPTPNSPPRITPQTFAVRRCCTTSTPRPSPRARPSSNPRSARSAKVRARSTSNSGVDRTRPPRRSTGNSSSVPCAAPAGRRRVLGGDDRAVELDPATATSARTSRRSPAAKMATATAVSPNGTAGSRAARGAPPGVELPAAEATLFVGRAVAS